MYRYLYIYHLEGHAEKTRDHSGIYSKKELRSFQSHTQKEAHGKTKRGTNVDTAVSGWPFNMGGAGQGTGLRATNTHIPARSPGTPATLAREQGQGLGDKCFWGAGGTCLHWAGSPHPDGGTWWVPYRSLLRSPTDHPQRREHPLPGPGAPLPWVQEELGSAACGVGQGWQQRLGG